MDVVHRSVTGPPADVSVGELTVREIVGVGNVILAFAKLIQPTTLLPHAYEGALAEPARLFVVEVATYVTPYPEPRKLMHPSQPVVGSPASAFAHPDT